VSGTAREVLTTSAVLDSAHLGDIEGAFGRIRMDATDHGRTLKTRLITLLTIVGPGPDRHGRPTITNRSTSVKETIRAAAIQPITGPVA
jgi:hypothetical protein